MIYCILGQTCSGKSTLLNSLRDYGFKTIPLYTTRKKRAEDIEGRDYHFVSPQEYFSMSDKLIGKFTAENKEKMRFAIHKQDLETTEDKFLIVSPSALKEISHYLGKENVTSIYLKLNADTRRDRGIGRGDEPNEFFRRIASDKRDYQDIKEISDYTLDSSNSMKAFNQILKITG